MIAIIAMLAALLAPALKQARNQARSIQCMNNLRQINLVLQQYAADHNGWYVPVYVEADGIIWSRRLMTLNYLTDNTISRLRCPSYAPTAAPGTAYQIIGYGLNDIALPWNTGLNPAGVSNPAVLMIVMETAYPYTNWYEVEPYAYAGAQDDFFQVAAIYAHQRGLNACFLDGHIERRTMSIPCHTGGRGGELGSYYPDYATVRAFWWPSP